MQDTPWDHGMKVTAEADGLVGHAGAVLLRKLADRMGLTAALGSALARTGKFPLVDRGVAFPWLRVAGKLVRHTRARVLKISRTWPWKEAFLTCWQRLCALPAPA